MVRWMKLVVLAAGAMGLAGFFLPFFVLEVDTTKLDVTAYQLLVRADDPTLEPLAVEKTQNCVEEAMPLELGGRGLSCDPAGPKSHRSFVPFFFASSIVMLVVGGIAIFRRRMGGFLALFTLAAGLLAIGGWLREINHYRMVITHLATGATLLGMSGVACLLASIAVMVWREPTVLKKTAAFRPELPRARILR